MKRKKPEYTYFFEYPFDFQTYLAQTLKAIDDLDERKWAKEALVHGLEAVVQTTEQKYLALEKRVYDEVVQPRDSYAIYSTVVEREGYDPINGTLFPLCPEDVSCEQPTLQELQTLLKDGQTPRLSTIYLEAPDEQCRAWVPGHRDIAGTLQTNDAPCPVKLRLRRAVRYRRLLAHLYTLFSYNCIPWSTVNSAFFDHFYDVELLELSPCDKQTRTWTGFSAEYGDLQEAVRENRIPLWNVERITYKSEDFILPRISTRVYEHEFPLDQLGREHGYLIDKNPSIIQVRRTEQRLIVCTQEEIFDDWKAYRIRAGVPKRSLQYHAPILGNRRHPSFAAAYLEQNGMSLHTRADITRRLRELPLEDYLEFLGLEVLPASAQVELLDDMNWFVKDEDFALDTRRILQLRFRALQPAQYLTSSLLRFAVSHIQLGEEEYRCFGVLTE